MLTKALGGFVIASVLICTGCTNSIMNKPTMPQNSLQSVLFDADKSSIDTNILTAIESNVKYLTAKDMAQVKIRVEGNTDERGTDEYCLAIGQKRADAIKAGYIANGIPAERIVAVSYGKNNPVCKEHNEECWRKNNRVDTRLER
jgi:peptidoglycan-associated lipoprotein